MTATGMPDLFMNNSIIAEDMERIHASRQSWDTFAEKHVLITGATGMLPSYLAFFFLYLHEHKKIPLKITACVRNPAKASRIFGRYLQSSCLSLLVGDINQGVNPAEKVNYIVHGASLASAQYYAKHPVDTLLPNVLGTYLLLELARQQPLECFLFLSSGSVYGKVDAGVVLTETNGAWFDPLAVESCYGESKRMGETMCAAWHRQYQVPARVVRLRHTYGPTMDFENDQRTFSYCVKCAVRGEDIHLTSGGGSQIEYLYISDAVRAFFTIMLHGKDGEAYNANHFERISVHDLAKLIVSFVPQKKLAVLTPNLPHEEKKEIRVTDTTKIERLGWQPTISIAEGFARTIRAIEEAQFGNIL